MFCWSVNVLCCRQLFPTGEAAVAGEKGAGRAGCRAASLLWVLLVFVLAGRGAVI